jgi:hypothetical protein
VPGFSEHGNVLSGSIEGKDFLKYWSVLTRSEGLS